MTRHSVLISQDELLFPPQPRRSSPRYCLVRPRDNSLKLVSSSKPRTSKVKSSKTEQNECEHCCQNRKLDDDNKNNAKAESKKNKSKESPEQPERVKHEVIEDKNKEENDWTAEQDAALEGMKMAGKTWAEIGVVLKKSKSGMVARWKEIKPAEDKTNQSKGHIETKKADVNDKQTSKQKGKKKDEEPPEIVHSDAGSEEPKMSLSQFKALLDDGCFSPGEIKDLYRLARDDDKEKWLRVASRFFDATGRRIHEEDVADKVHELLKRALGRWKS